MVNIESLKNIIAEADDTRLRELVIDWIDEDKAFAQYLASKLNKSSSERHDYDAELQQAIYREAYAVSSHHNNTNILDWSNIYYYQVKPWTDKADDLSTPQLMKLVEAIIVRIAMVLSDEDFEGDDWNGDDYSMEIGMIMDALGNTIGILLTREDFTEEHLEWLRNLIEEAEKTDVTGNYVGNPYTLIGELIEMREEAQEVTIGMFDAMVNANLDHKGGEWLCRKIDFVERMGLMDEAWQLAEENIKYPQVAIKLYLTLINEENWSGALRLLDRIIKISNDAEYRSFSYGNTVNWMEIKQKLLREHGSREEQIENLRQLFLSSTSDKETCYSELKELVDPEEWKDFYTKLFMEKSDFEILYNLVPFLAQEGEIDWLFTLLHDYWKKNPTGYDMLLKNAPSLLPEFESALKIMISQSFKEYAASRFEGGKRVKASTYQYFCRDLQKLVDLGFYDLLRDLINHFRDEYGSRPSFMAELRQIKIN